MIILNTESYLYKLNNLLGDLRGADVILRELEWRYGLASDIFYKLYTQGVLDTGENLADIVKWAGCYELRRNREQALHKLSLRWVKNLRQQTQPENVILRPLQPVS